MARPGFNGAHWFDLPFEEAVLVGWLGQFSSGAESLDSFRDHLHVYGTKVAKFYGMDEKSSRHALESLLERSNLLEVLGRLASRTKLLENFEVNADKIHFQYSAERLTWEIDYLKKKKIATVVSLTERHHQKDVLQDHFSLHHFSIEDLNAPSFEQVANLAEIIKESQRRNEIIAVHCLAGIGRTSTMLMGAHLLLDDSIEDLKRLLARQNPSFKLVGEQAEFIGSLVQRL